MRFESPSEETNSLEINVFDPSMLILYFYFHELLIWKVQVNKNTVWPCLIGSTGTRNCLMNSDKFYHNEYNYLLFNWEMSVHLLLHLHLKEPN